MDVPFGPLRRGTFLERLSRFHCRVRIGRQETLAHLPNSGRLVELLRPGCPVRLAPRSGPRLTLFDLTLARIPEPCAGWACTDARLPPVILARAMQRGAIPELAGYRLARREPRLGGGRADLLLQGLAGAMLLEAKSITLVVEGHGLFPDSPTARGTRHVRELAALARKGRAAAMAFVVQRPDALAVRPHRQVDPVFAGALEEAAAAGVRLLAGCCHVSWRGVHWARTLPVEL